MDGMEMFNDFPKWKFNMDYECVYVVSIIRAWKATQSGHKI